METLPIMDMSLFYWGTGIITILAAVVFVAGLVVIRLPTEADHPRTVRHYSTRSGGERRHYS